MNIKAIKGYYDRQTKTHVRIGAEYEVEAGRGKKLIEAKLAEEVKAAGKEPEAESVTEDPEAKTKKK